MTACRMAACRTTACWIRGMSMARNQRLPFSHTECCIEKSPRCCRFRTCLISEDQTNWTVRWLLNGSCCVNQMNGSWLCQSKSGSRGASWRAMRVLLVLLLCSIACFISTADNQLSALRALYTATSGDGWIKRDKWMNNSISYCEWHGITCSSKNVVMLYAPLYAIPNIQHCFATGV